MSTTGENLIRGTVIGHGVVPINECVEQLKKYNLKIRQKFLKYAKRMSYI